MRDELERIHSYSGKVYEDNLDPDTTTDPRKPSTNLDDWVPQSVRSSLEIVDKLDGGWEVEKVEFDTTPEGNADANDGLWAGNKFINGQWVDKDGNLVVDFPE